MSVDAAGCMDARCGDGRAEDTQFYVECRVVTRAEQMGRRL